MPTELIQLPTHPSGTAALRIKGPSVNKLSSSANLEIAVLQFGKHGNEENHLHPQDQADPWKSASCWIAPESVSREGGVLSLTIAYQVTYHLNPHQPYKLRVRDSVSGITVEEVFSGSASIRRPTAPPEGWKPPPGPSGPVSNPPAAQPPTEPEKKEPTGLEGRRQADAPPPPALTSPGQEAPPASTLAESKGTKQDTKSRTGLVMGLVGLLLAVGAGLAWWLFRPQDNPQEPKVVQPSEKPAGAVDSLESIRKFIGSGPDAATAKAKADELAKTGQLLDGQFLLYKYAGDKGDKGAAVIMGAFYDPDSWSKEKSPLPAANPLEASRWYKLAADGGDVEGQYRYGMALKKGRTDEPNAEEQSVVWLRKAAEAGHAGAKKEIGQ